MFFSYFKEKYDVMSWRTYSQTSNISCTLVSNKIAGHLRACRCCFNYIFILDLTHGFNWLAKNDCKTRRELFKCSDFACLLFKVCWCHHGCDMLELSSSLLLIKHASNVTINRCLTNRFRRKLRLMQETVAYPRHNTNVSSMVFKKIEKW